MLAVIQFATGALTNQRAFLIQAPTYGFVGLSTLSNAATVDVELYAILKVFTDQFNSTCCTGS